MSKVLLAADAVIAVLAIMNLVLAFSDSPVRPLNLIVGIYCGLSVIYRKVCGT